MQANTSIRITFITLRHFSHEIAVPTVSSRQAACCWRTSGALGGTQGGQAGRLVRVSLNPQRRPQIQPSFGWRLFTRGHGNSSQPMEPGLQQWVPCLAKWAPNLSSR